MYLRSPLLFLLSALRFHRMLITALKDRVVRDNSGEHRLPAVRSPENVLRTRARVFYSPAPRFTAARAYSRFSLAMKLALISAGQTASHSYVLVQLPNPSASITETIRSTRLSCSGRPCGRNDRCETFAAVKSMADPFGQAAAHAPHPMQAAASIAKSASCLGIRIEFASGAEPARAEMNPPACTIRSSALRSTTRSFSSGNDPTRNGSTVIVAPSRNFLM